jgi:hypothetical protein
VDLARDITAGEKVEADIDAFVTRRHEKRVETEGQRRHEEDVKAND